MRKSEEKELKRPTDGQYYCSVLLSWINITQYVSPWMTQYYCATFRFACGLQQVDMLSDTDAVCVTTGLAVCLKKKRKNRPWIKDWYNRRLQYTHENLMTDLMLSEPNDKRYFFFCPSYDAILKIVSPTIAKEIVTCDKQSFAVSAYP
jgi:hypothetical protein